MYLSGTYVRDYLLEPDPERAETYRVEPRRVRKHMEAALEFLRPPGGSAEVQHYTILRRSYRLLGNCDPSPSWDTDERRRSGYTFLRDEVFPRRQNTLAIADRIANINEQQLNAGNDQVVSLLLKFQTRLVVTLVAALGWAVAWPLLTMRRILKLEKQAHARYEEVAEARSELKGLSARLVQAQETSGVRFRASCTMKWVSRFRARFDRVAKSVRRTGDEIQGTRREHVETIKSLVEGTDPGGRGIWRCCCGLPCWTTWDWFRP